MKKYRNIIINTVYIVVGIVLVTLTLTNKIDNIFLGFGSGLIGVGAVLLFRAIKYHTNQKYKEQIDTENNDERNRYISMKAWSWAGYLFIIICAVIALVCVIMSQIVYSQIALCAVATITLLYYISYLVIRKKY